MNTLFLFLIGIPAIEIFVMIKIGQNIGALSTIGLIFLTAIVGVYFAKIAGINTLRSGIYNLYKNQIPLYEIFSGASIALAAMLLILPGFITDAFGFLLLIPTTRKFIIKLFLKKRHLEKNENNDFIEGEISKDSEKDKKDEF